MIIIDTQAAEKLVEALKSLPGSDDERAILFRRIPQDDPESRPRLITHMQRHFPDSELYICDGGDIVLMAHRAPFRECKKAIYEAAVMFGAQPLDSIGNIYDLSMEAGALLTLLEEKIETRRKAEEAALARRSQEQSAAQAAHRRKHILEQDAYRSAGQIAAQRNLRREPSLMIIEDDAFSRRLVENVLAKEYRLTGLESAENALFTYARLAPDLLFLDINLPDVTGHELLGKIMALDPDAYVVMLSGNSDRENVMQAMRLGAKGFVAKPFTREKLFQYIERRVALRKETVC
ncbi:MAG: response regulator [Pseudomonadota bacterium]|nr:response regulator [Pseudomonadota bacterium]